MSSQRNAATAGQLDIQDYQAKLHVPATNIAGKLSSVSCSYPGMTLIIH